ncbi:NusA N-terminal domain-containing protein, partial [Escherichia coli]|uniref:NusA N-terminal domain-containing protein n=1 Tax=Escherichia coli TaxID=562 RepID=UPI0025A2B85C
QIESVTFDRITTQTAKQVIVQNVREAERSIVVDQFRDHEGQIITALVNHLHLHHIPLNLVPHAQPFLALQAMISRDPSIAAARLRRRLVCRSRERAGGGGGGG